MISQRLKRGQADPANGHERVDIPERTMLLSVCNYRRRRRWPDSWQRLEGDGIGSIQVDGTRRLSPGARDTPRRADDRRFVLANFGNVDSLTVGERCGEVQPIEIGSV